LGGRCTGRFLALNAMENRVYDIELEDQTDHVVIKFYRPGRWSRETIEAEHKFLKLLHENEIPVVCPLTDPAGKTLFEINEVFYTIFPKRPGRLEPELNDEQKQRLGRFLARLHNVGSAVKKAPRITLHPNTYGRESLRFLMDNKLLPPSVEPHFKQLVNQICDQIQPYFEGVESILIHGDCHSGNVLWKGNEPYFIDFDDMLYGPPVQDIWMLSGGDDEYALKNRNDILDAYEEIRPFDHTTLRLIEPLRALRMIHFTAWIARRWEDGAFKMAFPTFGSERYWQEQIEGLSMQWEKIAYRENAHLYQ
jgi:Ser/Thr protein kinase RdoA (MazF antagonist)